MPTTQHRFSTPEPITLDLRNDRGSVDIVASTTTETTVEITSRHELDTFRVDYAEAASRLVIEPVGRFRHSPKVAITVHLPAGSSIEVHTASASVDARGTVGPTEVHTASGSITLDAVEGPAAIASASGSVRVASVAGSLTFQSASGSLKAEHVGGECRARSASGSITIGAAEADVAAKSVSGRVLVGAAHCGTLDLHSTSGSVGVGVRKGTLVWLDVASVSGRVVSSLYDDGDPTGDETALNLHAHSVSGSITIGSV